MSKTSLKFWGAISFLLSLTAQSWGQAKPAFLPITIKIRDQMEWGSGGIKDTTSANPQNHQFEGPNIHAANVNAATTGVLKAIIDTTGNINVLDSAEFKFDNRTPKLALPLATVYPAKLYPRPERFEEWYNDSSASKNRSFLKTVNLTRVGTTDNYEFRDDNFFPLDIIGTGATDTRKVDPVNGPDPFGLSYIFNGATPTKQVHNYGFTVEFHSRFTFVNQGKQVFTFTGDDDVWVFINGKLAIDLGGDHQALTATVDLDNPLTQQQLGLVDGETYILDFFYAERQFTTSHMKITTSILLDAKEVPAELYFTDANGSKLAPGATILPSTPTLNLIYVDDYGKGTPPDNLTLTIKNRNGNAPGDVETILVKNFTATQLGDASTWKISIPLVELQNAIPQDGKAETYYFSEVNASIKTRNPKGLLDGGTVESNLNITNPDVTGKIEITDAKNPLIPIDRATDSIKIKVIDQSFSKFQDTLFATVTCSGTGDVANVKLVEQQPVTTNPATYINVTPILKDEGNVASVGPTLTCKSGDVLIVKYTDPVYLGTTQDQVSWTVKGADALKFTSVIDLATPITQIEDKDPHTFAIVTSGADPTANKIDNVNIIITSPQGESETFPAIETGPNSGIFILPTVTYGYTVGAPIAGDGILQAQLNPNSVDNSVVFTAKVTIGTGSLQSKTITLTSSLNPVVMAYIKDENGDGRGDKVYVVFKNKLAAVPDPIDGVYWNVSDDAHKKIPKAGTVSTDGDKTVIIDFSKDQFPLNLTGIGIGAAPIVSLPAGSVFNAQKPVIVDSIGPKIVFAYKKPWDPTKTVPGSNALNIDTILVTLSEPLDKNIVDLSVLIKFGTGDGKQCVSYALASTLVGDVKRLTDTTYIILVNNGNAGKGSPLFGNGNNCAYLNAGGKYTDINFNKPGLVGVELGGSDPAKQVVLRGYPPVVGISSDVNSEKFRIGTQDNPNGNPYATSRDSMIAVYWIPPAGWDFAGKDATKFELDRAKYLPNGINGDVSTSIPQDNSRLPEPIPQNVSLIQVVSLGRYIANVSIFDNLGHFMKSFKQAFGYQGELDNRNRISQNGPRGMVSYLVWDLKDKNGAMAGQGVYIWKIAFSYPQNKKTEIEYVRIGLMRQK